jgi:hypothetical protein
MANRHMALVRRVPGAVMFDWRLAALTAGAFRQRVGRVR